MHKHLHNTHIHTHTSTHLYRFIHIYIGNKPETRYPLAIAMSMMKIWQSCKQISTVGIAEQPSWCPQVSSGSVIQTDRQTLSHDLLLTESPWPHFLHAEFTSKITSASSCLRGFQSGAAGENWGVCQRRGINSSPLRDVQGGRFCQRKQVFESLCVEGHICISNSEVTRKPLLWTQKIGVPMPLRKTPHRLSNSETDSIRQIKVL